MIEYIQLVRWNEEIVNVESLTTIPKMDDCFKYSTSKSP